MRTKLQGEPPWWRHPALVLLWKRISGGEWICKYFLSLPQDSRGDIRASGKAVIVPMGTTKVGLDLGERGRTPLEDDGTIYTPFRDGAHIRRDSAQLRLPAYVMCLGHIEAIEPLRS